MISLRSSHIFIKNDLVKDVFGNIHYAFVYFHPSQEILLISPVSSAWFKKIYPEGAQILLKDRNLLGDKTLAIHQVLIDNDLPSEDRDLSYEWIEKTNLLKIKL